MKIFSGNANKPLAEKIAKNLNIPLSELEIHVFPDGEKRVRVLERVVDEDVIVVQPTSMPVDSNFMELFFIVDAAKRSGAKSVIAVIPYLGYQRQDHVFREGEAVSLDVVVKAMQSVGVGKIIAFDFHSIKIPQEFEIPVSHLSALPIFAEKIKELGTENSVLVSPDMGGIRRIKMLSELLDNLPFASIIKNRDLQTGSVSSDELEGEVKETAYIVDDMISSGGTIAAACELLAKNGVKNIYVFATHPVFSDEAKEVLQNCGAQKIFVTDTIEIPKEKQFEKLEVLSVAQKIAGAIR